MKTSFKSSDFHFHPTAMAAALSSLTGRPVVMRREPKITVKRFN